MNVLCYLLKKKQIYFLIGNGWSVFFIKDCHFIHETRKQGWLRRELSDHYHCWKENIYKLAVCRHNNRFYYKANWFIRLTLIRPEKTEMCMLEYSSIRTSYKNETVSAKIKSDYMREYTDIKVLWPDQFILCCAIFKNK